MFKKKQEDKINFELSKAYFSNTEQKEAPKDKKSHRAAFFIIILLIGIVGLVPIMHLLISKSRINKKTASHSKGQSLERKAVAAKTIFKNETILYDFEKNDNGWEVPAWEFEKIDHVAKSLERTTEISRNGIASIRLNAEFPGGTWTGALIEIQHYLNLNKYEQLMADIYLPTTAPEGLKAKLILTVGEDWKFVEMSRAVKLIPGRWTTIIADLTEKSADWKRTKVNKEFREDVRKIAVRIESNNKPAYSGPIYIDNVRVSLKEKLSGA